MPQPFVTLPPGFGPEFPGFLRSLGITVTRSWLGALVCRRGHAKCYFTYNRSPHSNPCRVSCISCHDPQSRILLWDILLQLLERGASGPWLDHQLSCHVCGYSIRQHLGAACPECGTSVRHPSEHVRLHLFSPSITLSLAIAGLLSAIGFHLLRHTQWAAVVPFMFGALTALPAAPLAVCDLIKDRHIGLLGVLALVVAATALLAWYLVLPI